MSENETSATEAETTTGSAPEPVQLTLQDMQQLNSIIDLASRRGAFHASELSAVGAAYNKLSGFLEAVAAQQETDEGNKEEAPAPEAA